MIEQKLCDKSVSLILGSQAPGGAWMAASTFSQYRHCWLRDGSFIAYAMLVSGHPEPCRRFLGWGARVLERHAGRVEAVEKAVRAGGAPDPGDLLPTRFTVEGEDARDDWPNNQIDGYGTWLWCLGRYGEATGDRSAAAELRGGVDLALRYLAATWRLPCYDCWEENPAGIHPSTLSCVFGGIRAAAAMLGRGTERGEAAAAEADAVRAFVLSHTAAWGGFPKSVGRDDVDASLLWLSVPFGLVAPDDPRMRATAREIEARLLERGGVTRYARDTYYGGGQWILLTAWLGWYRALTGDAPGARECLRWAAAQADAEGNLPEQSLAIVNDPSYIPHWEARWGKAASPLLWSHAMFLVLHGALRADRDTQAYT